MFPLGACRRGAGPADRWRYLDGRAPSACIPTVTKPFCGDCDRVRLTADGQFRTCLFATDEFDLRRAMRRAAADDELAAASSGASAPSGPVTTSTRSTSSVPALDEPDRRLSGQSAVAVRRPCTPMTLSDFTHLDPLGRARMVDVTPKEPTHRRAVARCKVFMQPETTAAIANREVKKGDVLSVARVAGIQAAKRTADMIPLCHPLLVGSVSVNFEIGDDFVAVEVHVDTVDRTGVEMEALHACAIAALTIYDMCKSADRGMVDRRAGAVGEDRRSLRHLPARAGLDEEASR